MMTTTAFTRADDDALRDCLRAALPAARAPRPDVRVGWSRFALATSYDTHVATVPLADGEQLAVFVKDFGRSVRYKDGARFRREREVGVYRELLAGTGLGTAACYGAILDDANGRLWLLLEMVRGEPVGYRPLEEWAPAVTALGRVHAHFAGLAGRLAGLPFLVRQTREYFLATAESALHATARLAPACLARLTTLVRRYPPVVERIANQPPTLVHGGCRPTNILIRIAGEPERSCIVDWEEAGIGAPALDLIYLLDGIAPPLLDRLLDAYEAEARAGGLALPPRRELRFLMDCCHLHMTFGSLARAVPQGYDAQAVAKLVGIGERIGDVVFHRRG